MESEKETFGTQIQNFSIQLQNLCYSVHETKGKEKCVKRILQNINGQFRSGHLTAILGPSGAGKSTLLNILSGLRKSTSGFVSINGLERNVQEMKRVACYITQEFAMLPLLTTKETLMTAANLKLSEEVGSWKKNAMVNEIIELLGLNKVIDTYVGRLSGGEKKRLSIGVELLTNPPIMFFDEPTSGLDSSSSYQVITHLKSLAEGGRLVVCAIHQPSSRLFEMFDDIFILSEGNCFYNGPIRDITTYFEGEGFICPKYYNRADFAIEVVCGERGDTYGNLIHKDAEKKFAEITDGLTRNTHDITEETSMLPLHHTVGNNRNETAIQVVSDKKNKKERRFPVNLPTQFFILMKRCILCTMRDLHMAQLRTIAHIVVGLLLGALYYDVGNEASKIANNAACIFFFIMFLFFSNSMPTVHTFPMEASVFHREYLNNWYSLPAYYFSKIVAEIPLQLLCPTLFLCSGYFLTDQPYDYCRFFQFWALCVLVTILGQTMGLAIGAAFDSQLGIFLVPASSIPMILFSGFFLKVQDIPNYLHWLSYFSYFRYAFEGSMQVIYGYNRIDLKCSLPYCYFKSPSKILQEFGMEESNYGYDILGLIMWIVVLQIALYVALKWKLKIS